MAGFGVQPAGVSPAGYGKPSSASDPTGTVLRDELTGRPLDARKINPRTGAYERDANGRLLGMSSSRQIVLLAIRTTFGSAADKEMGNKLRKLDRITDNFRFRVLTTITDSLRRQIDAGILRVDDFSVFKAGIKDGLRPGQTYGRLHWFDLNISKPFEEVV